jgi:cell division protease FtsH
MMLPTEDRSLYSEKQFKALITVALGGRASELITFSEVTTGPHNDLEKATQLARAMVTQYGMSEKLGPRTFGHKEELVFLGREISQQRDYSDKVAEEIDAEIRRLIHDSDQLAQRILNENKETLHRLSIALMKKETLEAEELQALLRGEIPIEVEPQPAPALQPQPAHQAPVPQAKQGPMPLPKTSPGIQPAL